ncbi:MAG: enolase C-terminal domain-like protein [Planctomycetota bacterium]
MSHLNVGGLPSFPGESRVNRGVIPFPVNSDPVGLAPKTTGPSLPRPTDICIADIELTTEDFLYRTPIKFGGVALDRVTMLYAQVTVESPAGKRAAGRSSMPLGNVWAFPTKELAYGQTLQAMQLVAHEVRDVYLNAKLVGHPIEITWGLEHQFLDRAKKIAAQLNLPVPIPPLATLVAASPVDAAIHDAYGKLHHLNCYSTYSKEFLDNDLGRFIGAEFAGVRLDEAITTAPSPTMPLYHLVGALDPIFPEEVTNPVGDGLPESLVDWIRSDGLTHLKIKLNGDLIDWDVKRVLAVNKAAEIVATERGHGGWQFSLDFNERCQTVDYLLDFLNRLRGLNPTAYQRIAYIEQPTARDLAANRNQVIRAASELLPVVIDESLVDLDSLQLARELGYTGVALKACKGQSQSLIFAAAASHLGMSLCVQDLTCPADSLIHSAGLAAHIRGVAAIEANSRQYCPAANRGWDERFPGIFNIRNGRMPTAQLNGLGLGAW